jgi:cell division septum initiation protein DivIVA
MTEHAQFRTVRRGFDPAEVNTTVAELTTALTTARRTAAERTVELTTAQKRASALARELEEAVAQLATLREAAPAPSPADDLGPRVSAILALAEEEASQRRDESEREANEILRTAEAEAARMKAAAAEAADGIVQEASRQAAEQRRATAALKAQLAESERAAESLIESARQEALREGQRIQSHVAERARASEDVRTGLVGILDLLVQLDAELAAEVSQRPGADRATERRDSRPVPN